MEHSRVPHPTEAIYEPKCEEGHTGTRGYPETVSRIASLRANCLPGVVDGAPPENRGSVVCKVLRRIRARAGRLLL